MVWWGKRWAEELDRNSNGSAMEGDKRQGVIAWERGSCDCYFYQLSCCREQNKLLISQPICERQKTGRKKKEDRTPETNVHL